jgi:hypothetical protein
MSVVAVSLGVLIATADPPSIPRRTSQERPDVCTSSAAIVFSVIVMESGNLLRLPASPMSTIRTDRLVGWSNECFVSACGMVQYGESEGQLKGMTDAV